MYVAKRIGPVESTSQGLQYEESTDKKVSSIDLVGRDEHHVWSKLL